MTERPDPRIVGPYAVVEYDAEAYVPLVVTSATHSGPFYPPQPLGLGRRMVRSQLTQNGGVIAVWGVAAACGGFTAAAVVGVWHDVWLSPHAHKRIASEKEAPAEPAPAPKDLERDQFEDWRATDRLAYRGTLCIADQEAYDQLPTEQQNRLARRLYARTSASRTS